MHPSLLCLFLALPKAPASQPAAAAVQAQEPGYLSATKAFRLNEPIDLNLTISGIQIQSVTFRREQVEPGFFALTSAPGLATRVFLKVANGSGRARRLAIALALEDKEGRLLSAISTDRKPDKIAANKTEEIELRFTVLPDEAAKADHFKLVVEPRPE